jgi:hypothetical protein
MQLATAIIAQTDQLTAPQWATPSLLGVLVAGLIAFCILMKLWVDERKSNNELQDKHATRLGNLIEYSNTAISNNTRAMDSIVTQSTTIINKLDDIRERMMGIKYVAGTEALA